MKCSEAKVHRTTAYLAVLCISVGILRTSGASADPHGLIEKCGSAFDSAACACLARSLPNRHLTGTSQRGTCLFANPPISFDPSTASTATLMSWGISRNDAAQLKDPATRAAFYYGVKRGLIGLSEAHGVGVPSTSVSWRPNDGSACNLPANLDVYCQNESPYPKVPHH